MLVLLFEGYPFADTFLHYQLVERYPSDQFSDDEQTIISSHKSGIYLTRFGGATSSELALTAQLGMAGIYGVVSINGSRGVVELAPGDVGAATALQGERADSALQHVALHTGAELPKSGGRVTLPESFKAAGGDADTLADHTLEELVDRAGRELFTSLWRSAVGRYGDYNAVSGYFELNGLKDITYEQAQAIYATANCTMGYYPEVGSYNSVARTFIPAMNHVWGGFTGTVLHSAFRQLSQAEVVNLGSQIWYAGRYSFSNSPQLREIIGVINVRSNSTGFCTNNPKLQEFRASIDGDCNFSASSLLSYASIRFLVENRTTSTLCVVTLHPDALERARNSFVAEPVAGFATLDLYAANNNISLATT